MVRDLIIVGESPSHTRPSGQENLAFSGKTSHIIWDELENYGMSRKNCFVTNIVADKLLKGSKPTKEDIDKNRTRLEKEIKECEANVILAMGKLASEELLRTKLFSFLNESVGSIIECPWVKKWVIPCVHPAAVARDKRLKKKFQDCIWTAVKVAAEYPKTKKSQER